MADDWLERMTGIGFHGGKLKVNPLQALQTWGAVSTGNLTPLLTSALGGGASGLGAIPGLPSWVGPAAGILGGLTGANKASAFEKQMGTELGWASKMLRDVPDWRDALSPEDQALMQGGSELGLQSQRRGMLSEMQRNLGQRGILGSSAATSGRSAIEGATRRQRVQNRMALLESKMGLQAGLRNEALERAKAMLGLGQIYGKQAGISGERSAETMKGIGELLGLLGGQQPGAGLGTQQPQLDWRNAYGPPSILNPAYPPGGGGYLDWTKPYPIPSLPTVPPSIYELPYAPGGFLGWR